MCDFSGRLVAWLDRELPDGEAVEVERHVRVCAECRSRVDAYEEVSCALVAYCDAAMEARTRRALPPWVVPALASAAVAIVLFLVFVPPSAKLGAERPRVAGASPAMVVRGTVVPGTVVAGTVAETAPRPVKEVHRRHAIAAKVIPPANWAATEPAIRIEIPVEAMFPPGAVPEGITFVADLSMAADGSVQGLRLRQ